MQINSVVNYKINPNKQNFKGNSAASSPFYNFNNSQPLPLNAFKAYTSPQITENYREIETFKLPYLGDGKLYELSNGHKIILVPKIGQTIIHTYVGIGENNEPSNLKEASHILEHLIANYSSNAKTEDTKDILNKLGANSNAHTDDCFTGYHINALVINDNDFEDLVKIQSQMLQNKNFTEKDLEREKKIIIQELDSNDKFTANYIVANKLALKNLFNLSDSDSSIKQTNPSIISNIQYSDLVNYYNSFYRPDNMVTTIVGNVDDNSIKTISKYFNIKISPQNFDKQVNYPTIDISNPIQKTVRNDILSLDKNERFAYIDLAFIGPQNNNDKENSVMEVLNLVIDERIKDYSKNHNKELDLLSKIDEVSSKEQIPSIIRLKGNCDNENVEDNLKTIYSILHNLTQNPVSEEELSIVKNKIKSDWTHFAENSFFLSIVLSEQTMLSQNLDRADVLKKIDALTPQDIQNTAKKYLDLTKASLIVIHPQEQTENIKPSNIVSFKGNINPLDTKDIHEYVLPNNLRVIVDTRPGIARSTIKFTLNSKKMLYNNPEAAWYLAINLGNEQIKQKARKNEISILSNGNSQYIYTDLNGSPDKTLEIVTYARDILLNPDLNKINFEKTKKKLIDKDKPSEKSTYSKFNEEFFGDSPFVHHKGDIKSLEFEDVKTLHQQMLKHAQGTIFITIPAEEFEKNQNEIFKTLMTVPTLQPYDYNTIFNKYKSTPLEKNKVFIEENDSTQLKIRQTFKIIESGNAKDRACLLLMNLLLGGGAKSKLYQKLRMQDNLAYSANSDLDTKLYTEDLAVLDLSTTVPADNTENLKKAIFEFDISIKELTSKLISQEELNRAKNKLKSNLLGELEKSSDRNNVLSEDYNSYYGINYQKVLFNEIDNITPEYIRQLANYYLTQPSLLMVSGNKGVIKANKEYLATFGEIIQ